VVDPVNVQSAYNASYLVGYTLNGEEAVRFVDCVVGVLETKLLTGGKQDNQWQATWEF
jgi:hypothetical protein